MNQNIFVASEVYLKTEKVINNQRVWFVNINIFMDIILL